MLQRDSRGFRFFSLVVISTSLLHWTGAMAVAANSGIVRKYKTIAALEQALEKGIYSQEKLLKEGVDPTEFFVGHVEKGLDRLTSEYEKKVRKDFRGRAALEKEYKRVVAMAHKYGDQETIEVIRELESRNPGGKVTGSDFVDRILILKRDQAKDRVVDLIREKIADAGSVEKMMDENAQNIGGLDSGLFLGLGIAGSALLVTGIILLALDWSISGAVGVVGIIMTSIFGFLAAAALFVVLIVLGLESGGGDDDEWLED